MDRFEQIRGLFEEQPLVSCHYCERDLSEDETLILEDDTQNTYCHTNGPNVISCVIQTTFQTGKPIMAKAIPVRNYLKSNNRD